MTLRARIALSMILLVAISGGVAGGIGAYLLQRHIQREAEERVRQDLNAAREFYRHRVEAMAAALRFTALGERFQRAVEGNEVNYLAPRLAAVRESARLDFLIATDADGRVICRSPNTERRGDDLSGDRLTTRTLEERRPVAGTFLAPLTALAREDPGLAERARVRIVPTARAAPTASGELSAGLTLAAAVPVSAPDGRLVGALRAGALLNGRHELVDEVRNIVFRDEQYAGKPLGTATLFQDDVRIATNVLAEDGSRAIGSRVSAEVREHVLQRGQVWVGPAWVVNDWYISAYAPLRDVDDRIVGILYVGVLERKFRDLLRQSATVFGAVTLAGLAAAALAAYRLAHGIARPVQRLADVSKAVAHGDFSQALPVRSHDEIGSLTHSFNVMARSLKERDDLLKERTRQQLTRSERLASIGRLAAGVAHEINNPLTGVLTFAHMLRKSVADGSQERKDLETIIEATMRCREIVRGLLNFSRQNEPHKELSDLNQVLQRALNLTRNQAALHRIDVREELNGALPPVVIDPHQIQEVAVNVIVNAIDAMPDGGRLTVRSRTGQWNGGRSLEFEISDTGLGIPPENLDRIFDPFFTTKPPGRGTGLGLAVSYGIIAEHGGRIDVESTMGAGTTVTVRLPAPEPGAPARGSGTP
jgi:two-component system NtrC family sensor kinase